MECKECLERQREFVSLVLMKDAEIEILKIQLAQLKAEMEYKENCPTYDF